MKHVILFLFNICISLMLHAQVSKTVNVSSGGLSAALTPTERSTVTNLTVKGSIDARDFKTMRENIPLLAVLDLRGATIVAYTGNQGPANTSSNFEYPANEIPYSSFFNMANTTAKNSLKLIYFPSNISSIGDWAFLHCTGLSGNLTIPSSVTNIGKHAFNGCSGLIGNLTIPFKVTKIGEFAFATCIGLSSVSIPSSVTSIGTKAFDGCVSLTSIYASSSVPVDLISSFEVFINVNKTTCTLYVPVGSKGLYAAADEWKDFTNIVESTDLIQPIVTDFTIPATSNSLIVPVSSFSASDNKAVTGFKLTETATAPLAADAGWTTIATSSYTFATEGTKTLYAWAKDAAGNVSTSLNAQIVITLPDVTKPVVTAFTIPATSNSLVVPVISFTATDNKAVTGFKLTETSSAPLAGDAGWTIIATSSYTFATEGTKTLYAWVKDEAENVSDSKSASVIINLTTYSEYLFEESGGTTVIDSKGPNNGTIINNAARINGASGGGLEFTGTEYISLGQSFGENVQNEVTLSVWIKPATTGNYQGIIMHGGPNIDTYALYIRPDSKEIAFKTSGTTNDWISIKNVANLWDGDWHQLAVTYNGTQKVIYLDSVAIITVDATGSIESGAGYNLLIGAGRDTESPTLLYKGLIDEVRIFNYALTGAQIAELYNLIDTNPPTLTLSKTNLEFTSSSGSSTVNVTSNVNWTASDDAAWLTVSPASGLDNGTITITATSANTTATPRTGTVTITGSGITRTVTVTQNGVCQPGWVVVTSTNTTTAYCKVTIEGIPASADDKLGVFVGNECRGIGNIVMNNNEAYSTIMIQGISPETVGFRIWDASECSELMACGTFTTNPGGSVGNPPNYLIVNVCTDKTQALNLIGGWNLASLYVNTEAKSPKQIFGGSTCIAQVKNMTKSWDPSVPDFLNTLQLLSKGEGYFIKTKNACNIEITGPYIGNEHSINLISGWNLIGYPYDICQPVTSGIKTLLDNNKLVQLKNMTQSYDPLVPDFLNTLKFL